MRSIPGMVVLCPGDLVEAELTTRAAAAHSGPVYLRLGSAKGPPVHTRRPSFEIGQAITLSDGSDVTIIATGDAVGIARDAASELAGDVSVRLLSMPCLKPIDRDAIAAAAEETRCIVTVEEHNVVGGLGSAVAEILSEYRWHAPLARVGVPDVFFDVAGNQEFLRSSVGLTVSGVVGAARRLLHDHG